MARPRKTDSVDLTQAHDLTAGLIERLACPQGKTQAFLRDAISPGLRVRVTTAGAKSFVFEAKLNRQTIRRTIGDVRAWTIKAAREESNRLRVELDRGEDPRELEKAKAAEKAKQKAIQTAQALTVGDLWPEYLETGKPKRRDAWKPRYLEDLKRMSSAGGQPKKRGKGETRPGPIYPLLSLALIDISEDTLKEWQDREAKTSKHQAARALMMFRGFLRWCATKPKYRELVDKDAGRAPALLEALPSLKRRTDVLETAQMRGWWAGTEQLNTRTACVYLRALLLTGARREEVATLTWDNVDFQWRNLTLADKMHPSRTVPLTPYLAQLLATLPRTNKFVFAGKSKSGHIVDVRASHSKVLTSAGIKHLTFHGLRRANKQRGRAVVPHGAVDQMQGHSPSGTADGYAILPIDDLRPYAEQIEAHILKLAGVQFDPQVEPGKLRMVSNS
ncbi:MAG: integrase family protein [Aquabacterium sp.]|nr:integrase family protein [Aquabacterium sp.]